MASRSPCPPSFFQHALKLIISGELNVRGGELITLQERVFGEMGISFRPSLGDQPFFDGSGDALGKFVDAPTLSVNPDAVFQDQVVQGALPEVNGIVFIACEVFGKQFGLPPCLYVLPGDQERPVEFFEDINFIPVGLKFSAKVLYDWSGLISVKGFAALIVPVTNPFEVGIVSGSEAIGPLSPFVELHAFSGVLGTEKKIGGHK